MNSLKGPSTAASVFILALFLFSNYYPYNSGVERAVYYNQYRNGYDYMRYPYQLQNSYRYSGAANYVAGYGQIGGSPFLMPSTSCGAFGCNTNYNSHIYVRNALDYAYYTHPELLEPRYMDNHQRYVRSLWPQGFAY